MKGIVKINSDTINVNGTSLMGYIETTFDYLKKKLGEPLQGCDKTTAEWHLEFPDGTVSTIYDWKLSHTPKGEYHWHIGGHTTKCTELVGELLGVKEKVEHPNFSL